MVSQIGDKSFHAFDSHSLKFPGISLSLHCGSFPGNCASFLCVTSRVHSICGERCRDSVAWLGFTTTYKTAGTAKLRGSRTRHRKLWVGLWVGKSPRTRSSPHIRFPEPRFWTAAGTCAV